MAATYAGSAFLPVFTIGPSDRTTLNPFGRFDLSFLDDDKFEGGGANDALGRDETTSVGFGFGAASTAAAPGTALFSGFSSGALGLAARFQQVNAGAGGDVLSGGAVAGTTPVPLPAAASLLLPGQSALAMADRRRASAA